MQDRHDRSTTAQVGEAHIDDAEAHQVVSVEPVAIAWSTFVDGDTTPDINESSYWKEANTGSTTITNFDNPKANIHKITILFTTVNTTIQNNANVVIQAGSDFAGEVDDVKVFLWDGTNWVEQPSVANQLIGVTYFPHDSDVSDIGGYDTLERSPADHAETTHVTNVAAGDGDVAIEEFITDAGDPGAAAIIAGIWEFHVHAFVDTTVGTTNLKLEVYKRTTGGAETLILSTEREMNSTSVTEFEWSYVQDTDTVLNLTDRLVVKFLCNTTSVPQRTVTTYYEGSDRTAHIHTPVTAGATATGGIFREIATGNVFGPASAGRDALTGDYNFVVGDGAGDALTSGSNNFIAGRDAGTEMTTAYENIVIGPYAFSNATGEDNNVVIGTYAGEDITTANYTVILGAYAAYNAIDVGVGNILIGAYCGSGIVEIGDTNIGIGPQVFGTADGNSRWNIGIGDSVLHDITTGENNQGMGEDTLSKLTTGDYNAAYGVNSLVSIVEGFHNTAFGGFTGSNATVGSSRNVFLGYSAGPTAGGAINDLLYIDNHVSDTPLIEGDFSGHTIHINGEITADTKTFKIVHPLDETKYLQHGTVESPEYGLIYRGEVKLEDGVAVINIDDACGMRSGTFDALVQKTTVYLQNMSGFSAVRPSVVVNGEFSIICQDTDSDNMVSWMVCGERKDGAVMKSAGTDANGHLILEKDIPARKLGKEVLSHEEIRERSRVEREQRQAERKVEHEKKMADRKAKQEERKREDRTKRN